MRRVKGTHASRSRAVARGVVGAVDKSSLSAGSLWSILSYRSLGSAGSILSIGSVGSILSIGSAGGIRDADHESDES